MRKCLNIVTGILVVTIALGVAAAAIAKEAMPAGSKKVLLDNDQVRVVEVRRAPGTVVPMHSHPTLIGYYFEAAKVKSTSADGKTQIKDIPAGKVIWFPDGMTHAIEIVGTNDQHVLVIELKK